MKLKLLDWTLRITPTSMTGVGNGFTEAIPGKEFSDRLAGNCITTMNGFCEAIPVHHGPSPELHSHQEQFIMDGEVIISSALQ